jgi:hypothetical protein
VPGITREMKPGEARGCERPSLDLNGPSPTSTFVHTRTLNPDISRRQIYGSTIVLYLSRKGLSAVAIHDDLVATLGAEAVSYPPVTRYLREAIFASSNRPDSLPPPKHQLDDFDQAILLALTDQLFASIRKLSQFAHLLRTTAHRRLM